MQLKKKTPSFLLRRNLKVQKHRQPLCKVPNLTGHGGSRAEGAMQQSGNVLSQGRTQIPPLPLQAQVIHNSS